MLLLGKGMMHYPTDQELALEKLFFTNGIGMQHHLSLDALFLLFAPGLEFFLDKISFDNFSNVNKIILWAKFPFRVWKITSIKNEDCDWAHSILDPFPNSLKRIAQTGSIPGRAHLEKIFQKGHILIGLKLWNQVTSSVHFWIQNSGAFFCWKLWQAGCYDVAKFRFVNNCQLSIVTNLNFATS